jgi:hypothetical protein
MSQEQRQRISEALRARAAQKKATAHEMAPSSRSQSSGAARTASNRPASQSSSQFSSEHIQGRLADSIGAVAETARAAGLPKQAVRNIVDQAYSKTW